MIQLKAFRILSSLKKEEFAEFDKFVQSSYFNRSKDVLNLFFEIKKYYPEFSHPKLDYDRIYKKLYPGKLYTEGTIRNLFSELGSLAEKFLAYVNYENSFDYRYRIVSETNARYLDKEFEKSLKKTSKWSEDNDDPFYSKNLNSFFLESELHAYAMRRNDQVERKSRNSIYEPLCAFFLTEFLIEQSCQLNVAGWGKIPEKYNIVEIFFELSNAEEIIAQMKKNNSPFYDNLNLAYTLSIAAQNKDGKFYENFDRAYRLFTEKIDGISKIAQLRIYIWVINIINMHIKAGDHHLSKIKHNLCREIVEKELVLDKQGKMNAGMYSHTLHNAIVAGEISWAKDFLEKKIDAVDDEAKSKADIYNYYKAKLLSLDKKYIESNEILLKVSKEDITFKAECKVLRLINFYELGYIEAGFSHAETFKQLLIRKEESDLGRKELSSNFLKFYLILLRRKAKMEIDVSFAKQELAECKYVRSRAWLLEKFEELEKC